MIAPLLFTIEEGRALTLEARCELLERQLFFYDQVLRAMIRSIEKYQRREREENEYES
jgi:hypothetical protein